MRLKQLRMESSSICYCLNIPFQAFVLVLEETCGISPTRIMGIINNYLCKGKLLVWFFKVKDQNTSLGNLWILIKFIGIICCCLCIPF